jgi:glycosyltransferase involved in cell wall biosynthesis
MNNVLDLASGVITNSQATLDALQLYARKTGHPMPLAVTALLAAPVFPAPSLVRPMAAPYFVMLSTIEPRKNHWLLLQLWRRLVECMGASVPRLVVIGQRGWECENVVDLLERCQELRGVVMELPACSDADLATYLHHAQALLFPSFAEGYGMPLVEALSAGVPVIASDLPVFREIAGDIPDYLDPLDGIGWMSSIEAYTNSDSFERTAQLKRVAQFVPPSWSAHFQVVEELLERLG